MANKNKILADRTHKQLQAESHLQRLQKEIDDVVPNVYAGIALALHRTHGWNYEQIRELFVESQYLWTDYVWRGESMTEICLKETGIDVLHDN